MRNLNSKGMSFEEWVCAAGVGKFDYLGTIPYTLGGVPMYSEEIHNSWKAGVDPLKFRRKVA